MINPFEAIEKKLDRIESAIEKLASNPDPLPPNRENYLTTDQVCEMLSVSRPTLWTWDKKKILNSVRIGNAKRYRLSDIESLGRKKEKKETMS